MPKKLMFTDEILRLQQENIRLKERIRELETEVNECKNSRIEVENKIVSALGRWGCV